jgi:diamine N-acetyltransferase
MKTIVRIAEEKDYEDVCRLLAEGDIFHATALPDIFRTSGSPSRTREQFSFMRSYPGMVLFVAESNGRLIGLINAEMRETPEFPILVNRRYVYIGNIVVENNSRGKGIGTRLMNKVERWAIENGIHNIELNVWDFNVAAIDLFKHLGFWDARHQMWKSIDKE